VVVKIGESEDLTVRSSEFVNQLVSWIKQSFSFFFYAQ
jgi:hypothetical protein